MSTIVDISRTLSSQTAVWPGDQAVASSWTVRRADGSAVNIGALSMSLHAGTHVDAPLHYDTDGPSVDHLPLRHFIGPASVVEVTDTDRIHPEDIKRQVLSLHPRMLFKTSFSGVSTHEWRDDFASIAPATVEWFGERGVVLIGTDAPPVDPVDSTELAAHHALQRCGIVNLEGLCLRDVAPGMYRLVALPLKLEGMDASPVRAVLLDAA